MLPPLFETNLSSLQLIHRGKVRDLYEIDVDKMLIVQTDRISAFDHILPNPIPRKGEILTKMSEFWFKKLRFIINNHYLDLDPTNFVSQSEKELIRGRALMARKLNPLPVEAVVRGYLVGSAWKDYKNGGEVCGNLLPQGLRQAERLPTPLFTPSTKAAMGSHDQNISFVSMEKLIGERLADEVRKSSVALYQEAFSHCEQRGIILADTKFEFGIDEGGKLWLIDEVITPDSSRFWPIQTYGLDAVPPSFDKQFIREWLENIGWNKSSLPPEIPEKVIAETVIRYEEAFKLIC